MGAVKNIADKKTGNNPGVYKLSKPFEWEGKSYTEFDFDFENLKGTDMIDIENEMAINGEYAVSPEISTSYLSKLAARAAGVGSDVIENMPIKDFNAAKNRARDFLINMDSEG